MEKKFLIELGLEEGIADQILTRAKEEMESLKGEFGKKIRDIEIERGIEAALSDMPKKYRPLIKGLIDRDKISLKEDMTTEGLKEQVEELKGEYGELFEKPVVGARQESPVFDTVLAGIFGVE